MNYLFLLLLPAGILAGLIQGMTGFGMGIILMLFLPLFLSVGQSAAISQTTACFLCLFMAWRYRKYIKWRLCFLPWLFYFPVLFLVYPVAVALDTAFLKPALGLFLVVLSVYCIVFSSKIKIKESPGSAFICAGFSAAIDSFFGLGGPPMVLYFLATTDTTEEYLGTIQSMFAVTCIGNCLLRVFYGQFSLNTFPILGIIICSLVIGVVIGGQFVKKIEQEMMKKLIYGFIGVSGFITFLFNVMG